MMTNKKPFVLLALVLACTFRAPGQDTVQPAAVLESQSVQKQRLFHIFPDLETVQPGQFTRPLSVKDKFHIFTAETFDPSVVVIAAAAAGIQQSSNLAPRYGQGGEAFAQRFGAVSADFATISLLSEAVIPTLAHEDPRYYRKATGSVGSRIWYAIERTVVTRTDSGKPTINVAQIGGLAASTAVSNAYYPAIDRTAGQSASRFGVGVGIAALLNVLREFGNKGEKK
jgi:hypothetical protein